VGAAVPQHHRPSAILALRNRSLEGVVLDGMVFDFHGEASYGRVVARSLRHGPALHHAVQFETKIEVERTRGVLLHDETKPSFLGACRALASARWLGGFREVTLASVFGERRLGSFAGRP